MTDSGTQVYGDIRVSWVCDKDNNFCHVKTYWQDEPILDATLNSATPTISFSAAEPTGTETVAGNYTLESNNNLARKLLLELQHDDSVAEQHLLWPSGPVPPTPPLPPDSASGTEIINENLTSQTSPCDDLFPYLYIEPWPKISQGNLEDRFISYDQVCDALIPETFYCEIVAIEGNRQAVRQKAVDFINSNLSDTQMFPQSGCPLCAYGEFDIWLRENPKTDIEQFVDKVIALFNRCPDVNCDTWEDVAREISEDAYLVEVDQLWQWFFALTITSGYQTEICENLIRTIEIASLLCRIAETTAAGEQPDPEQWTAHRIHQGACASIILPVAISPDASPTTERRACGRAMTSDDMVIKPYAFGKLQITRQKLARYEFGEVCAIENVLKGEYKESTKRSLDRRSAESVLDIRHLESNRQTAEFAVNDINHEISKFLKMKFELSYDSTYGPVTGDDPTVSSIVKIPDSSNIPQFKLWDKSASFAKSVTEKVASKMSRSIHQLRSIKALNENEEIVTNRIDRTAATENLRGVYRWVNKIYTAWSENYGQRLIIECIIPNPAKAYIASAQALNNLDLVKPIDPADLGLSDFTKVSSDPDSELYYAKLSSFYGATKVTPPPEAIVTLGYNFRSGSNILEHEFMIPQGYEAVRVFISVIFADSDLTAKVTAIFGRVVVTVSSDDAQAVAEPLDNETSTLPCSFIYSCGPSPSGAVGKMAASSAIASVEIETTPTEHLFQSWQIEIYQRIMLGYKKQLKSYYKKAGSSQSDKQTRNPNANLQIIQDQLKKQITNILINSSDKKTDNFQNIFLGRLAYLDFLEHAFEWREMYYSFTVVTQDNSEPLTSQFYGEDVEFTAFLQAELSRVLLPVNPSYSYIIPYFLASGLIWSGENDLTPVNQSSIDVVNELKNQQPGATSLTQESEQAPTNTWEIRIPTQMTVLQEGDELPGIKKE